MTERGSLYGKDRRISRIWCRRNFPRLPGQCFDRRLFHLQLKLHIPTAL